MGDKLPPSLATLQRIQPLLGNLCVRRAWILCDHLFVKFYSMFPVVLLLLELRCFKLLLPLVAGTGKSRFNGGFGGEQASHVWN